MLATLIVSLLSLACMALLMATLVEWQHAAPAVLCAIAMTVLAALVYVCGDERGFLSDSHVGYVIAEHDRQVAQRAVVQEWEKTAAERWSTLTPKEGQAMFLDNLRNEKGNRMSGLT